MNPYEVFLNNQFTSFQELYATLEFVAKNIMGLDGVPFPLSALEHPTGDTVCPEIWAFIIRNVKAHNGDNSETEAIRLIKYLKKNHPKKSYENPTLSKRQPSANEFNLIQHIFRSGIDLPGSMHNPYGHLQYFSSFFIDMFFGNYTEFNNHLKTLSKKEKQKMLLSREGYCQFSAIFAPILGYKMIDIEKRTIFTRQQVQEIRSMYSGCNENEFVRILMELINLGADVHAHDINGFTPLHYAVFFRNEAMILVLLRHGANPNSESRIGWRPLTTLANMITESSMKCISILIHHNAKVTNNKEIEDLRSSVETYGSQTLAIKVREAHPRRKEECEKCVKSACKRCSGCGKVYYCTPACQKMDWKFHKVSCRRKIQASAPSTHSKVD